MPKITIVGMGGPQEKPDPLKVEPGTSPFSPAAAILKGLKERNDAGRPKPPGRGGGS